MAFRTLACYNFRHFYKRKKVDILCTWVHGTSVCQPSSCGFPLHRNIFSEELLVVRSRMVAQFLAIRTNYHCYGIIFQTWMCHLSAIVRNVDAAVFIFLVILNLPYSNYQGIHALGNNKSFNSSVKCRLPDAPNDPRFGRIICLCISQLKIPAIYIDSLFSLD